MAEGLRERKKRQTRQHISDVATGLFLAARLRRGDHRRDRRGRRGLRQHRLQLLPGQGGPLPRPQPAASSTGSRGCVRGQARRGVGGRRRPARTARGRSRRSRRAVGLIDGYDRLHERHAPRRPPSGRGSGPSSRRSSSTWRPPLREEAGAAAGDPLPLPGRRPARLAAPARLLGWIGARDARAAASPPRSPARPCVLLDEMEELLGERGPQLRRTDGRLTADCPDRSHGRTPRECDVRHLRRDAHLFAATRHLTSANLRRRASKCTGCEGCAVARKLAVIGAGLMGSGIAQVSAQAGWDVVLRDVTDEALTRGKDGIKASYEKFVSKGKLDGGRRRGGAGPHHHHHRPGRRRRRRHRRRGGLREDRDQARDLPRAGQDRQARTRSWPPTPPPSRSPRSRP